MSQIKLALKVEGHMDVPNFLEEATYNLDWKE
jgi:hypothetical protein